VAYLLSSLPEYKEARRISIYLSMPAAEISTRAMVLRALQEKKQIYIPFTFKNNSSGPTGPKSAMDMVSLQSEEDYESLQPDPWGIPTPSEEIIGRSNCILGDMEIGHFRGRETSKETLEVIIMPGVAFDQKLSRLGHGKGFYDSFLQRYEQIHTANNSGSTKHRMPFLGKVLYKKGAQLIEPNKYST
jgi:5-formyltetrahydrofolate cyclo-ligase